MFLTTEAMKKRIKILAFCVLSWLPFIIFGQKVYNIDQVPNVQLDNALHFVSNPDSIISRQHQNELNSIAKQIRDSLGIEVAIVVLQSYDSNRYSTAREFASKLFERWGIGNTIRDDGLLILLFTREDQREIVFEVGHGLENKLTDVLSKRIQFEKMVPIMKDGNYGDGLIAGLLEIQQIVAGKSKLNINNQSDVDELINNIIAATSGILSLVMSFVGWWIFVRGTKIRFKKNATTPYKALLYLEKSKNQLLNKGCIVAIFSLPIFIIFKIIEATIHRNFKKNVACDSCGTKGSIKLHSEVLKKATYKQVGEVIHSFCCQNCNHQHTEIEILPILKNYSSDNPTSYSGGGSWGGGGSGGGGASTRF